MYGINFFIYFSTSIRIRGAYQQFLHDIWGLMFKVREENTENVKTETSLFWIGLRNMDQSFFNKEVN